MIISDKSLLEQEGLCHLRLPCHGKPQLEINEQRLHVEANVNDWVVVKYENSYFPGIVIESTEQDVKVKVMHQAGPLSWKWPEKDDCIYYVPSDIMKVIEPPMITSTREHYKFQCSIP